MSHAATLLVILCCVGSIADAAERSDQLLPSTPKTDKWVVSVEQGSDGAILIAKLPADTAITVSDVEVTPTMIVRCENNVGEVSLDFGVSVDDSPPRRTWRDDQELIDYHWPSSGLYSTRVRPLGAGFVHVLMMWHADRYAVELRPIGSKPVIATFTVTGHERIRMRFQEACPDMAKEFWSDPHSSDPEPPRDFSWDPSLASEPPLYVVSADPPASRRWPSLSRLKHVPAVYPEEALKEDLENKFVAVEIFIDATGSVAAARVVRAHPLLNEAALEAVRQWKFAPYVYGGFARPVVSFVIVHFKRP